MPRALSKSEVDDFRDRLCEAATRLFAEKGYEGVTLRELAAELDVSPMTPYRYFRDKDEILAAARARSFLKFSQALEAAYANAKGNAIARANAVGQAYLKFAFANPAAYRLMFDVSQAENSYPELTKAAERARLTMTRHLHPLVKEGLLKGDPDIVGHVFWAMLHGLIMLRLAGKLDPKCRFDDILDEAFRALTFGLAPRG